MLRFEASIGRIVLVVGNTEVMLTADQALEMLKVVVARSAATKPGDGGKASRLARERRRRVPGPVAVSTTPKTLKAPQAHPLTVLALKRAKMGVCAKCDRKAVPGKRLCGPHLLAIREVQKKAVASRKKNGS